jgi:hypothetical protein
VIATIGLWIPAAACVIMYPWRERSRAWQIVALLTLAGLGSVVIQGIFNRYHFVPLLAGLAAIVGMGIADHLRLQSLRNRKAMIGLAICLAGTLHVARDQWYRYLKTRPSAAGLVNRPEALRQQYNKVISKSDTPDYLTKLAVADRINTMVGSEDPIAILYFDPWLYYLADRKPVHGMTYVDPGGYPNQYSSQYLIEELLHTVAEKQPAVVLARIPEHAIGTNDTDALNKAVFDHLDSFFGAKAKPLRSLYHVVDTIDDVAILQPMTRSAKQMTHAPSRS